MGQRKFLRRETEKIPLHRPDSVSTFSSFNILNERVLRLQAARSRIPINCGLTGCQLQLRNSVLIFTFCAGYELSRCSFFSVTH